MTGHYNVPSWVLPPSDTWLSLFFCATFEVLLLFLCFHKQGPELAQRGPSVLGRWLNPRVHVAGPAPADSISPPSSMAQSWRLGALHERFVTGARAGEEPTLREAGAMLGVGRPLTQEELVSLARVSEQVTNRPRCCGGFSNCLCIAVICGVVATFGLWVLYLTAPHQNLEEVFWIVVEMLHATPAWLPCLATLTISTALVCDGFRASDEVVGGRIALSGVVGAIAAMFFSAVLRPWDRESYATYPEQCMVLHGFSAAALATVAVKFNSSPAGFLAVVSAFYCATWIPEIATWTSAHMVGAIVVDGLFGLAVFLRLKTRTLQTFCSGFMAMGVFLLHATLLVNSFSYYNDFWHLDFWRMDYREHGRSVWPHVVVQLLVFLGLLAGWLLGKAVGCDGLMNNTLLFGALYVFATVISVSFILLEYGGVYLGWAMAFVGLWRVGLYLQAHRDFFCTLWALDAALLTTRRGCGGSGSNCDSSNRGGFEQRPGGELLLDEDPLFEPEMGMPRHVAKQSPSSDASGRLFRSGSAAAYGVLPGGQGQ